MIENLRISFQGIWYHKMRSFLTMLGIIIGIAAIIAIVSTIKGTSEQIKENLIGSGNNNVSVSLYQGDSEYSPDIVSQPGITPPLLREDQKSEVLRQEHVVNATYYHSRSSFSGIYYQKKGFQGGTILGIDQNYMDTCNYQVVKGRLFTERDQERFMKNAILDSNAAQNLFPNESPVGKIIEIGKEPFTIVGVVTTRNDSMPKIETYSEFFEYFQNVMGKVFIPSKTWPVIFSFDEPENVIIKADSTDNMSSVGKSVETVLNENIDKNSSQYIYKADDILKKVKDMQKLSESTNQQLIWIASISLLVGGIGVMNIMLVSVTERTKEIGLKKAIGARKRIILLQFLTEAVVLTSIGGILGVLSGIVLSKAVSSVTGTPAAISVPAIMLSVAFSMMIGIIFGLLPSVKAANLNPIDALRSE